MAAVRDGMLSDEEKIASCVALLIFWSKVRLKILVFTIMSDCEQHLIVPMLGHRTSMCLFWRSLGDPNISTHLANNLGNHRKASQEPQALPDVAALAENYLKAIVSGSHLSLAFARIAKCGSNSGHCSQGNCQGSDYPWTFIGRGPRLWPAEDHVKEDGVEEDRSRRTGQGESIGRLLGGLLGGLLGRTAKGRLERLMRSATKDDCQGGLPRIRTCK